MNRVFLYLFPDRQATLLAAGLSLLAFLIALLDMASRDFSSAGTYLNLSVAIIAAVFVLKYLSMRATYEVAEHAQAELRERFQHLRQARPRQPTEAEQLEQERAQMAELAEQLRQALRNIEPNTPLHAKYVATLELMSRFSRRA